MKIKYTKKHLRTNLVLGIVWTVFCFVGFIIESSNDWGTYGYLVISILYFALYFYQRRSQYLEFTDDYIKVHDFTGKKLKLTDIIQIKKFAGDYIIKTKNRELIINTQIIDPDSLEQLNNILTKIDLPADKTPFH